jgi:hypothetical protein
VFRKFLLRVHARTLALATKVSLCFPPPSWWVLDAIQVKPWPFPSSSLLVPQLSCITRMDSTYWQCHKVNLFFFPCRGVRLSPLGTWATIWPIAPSLDSGWWWAWTSRWNEWQGKLKYSWGNLPECRFAYHRFHITWTELEPGQPRFEARRHWAVSSRGLWFWLGCSPRCLMHEWSTGETASTMERQLLRYSHKEWNYSDLVTSSGGM